MSSIASASGTVSPATHQLTPSPTGVSETSTVGSNTFSDILSVLSPGKILSRGYSLITDALGGSSHQNSSQEVREDKSLASRTIDSISSALSGSTLGHLIGMTEPTTGSLPPGSGQANAPPPQPDNPSLPPMGIAFSEADLRLAIPERAPPGFEQSVRAAYSLYAAKYRAEDYANLPRAGQS
jgi:hypothetical protein